MDPTMDGAEDTKDVKIPGIAALVKQEAIERDGGSVGLHEVKKEPVQDDAGEHICGCQLRHACP